MVLSLIAIALIVVYLLVLYMRNDTETMKDLLTATYPGGKYVFAAVFVVSSFMLTAGLVSLSNEYTQFLGFLTGVGLMAVGVSPLSKDVDSTQKNIYKVGAYMFCIASQLWVAFAGAPGTLVLWLAMVFMWKFPYRTLVAVTICGLTLLSSVILSIG